MNAFLKYNIVIKNTNYYNIICINASKDNANFTKGR